MKIALGCDHGGYAMKEDIKKQLEGLGHEVKDCGTYSTESCDYPIFGEAAARAVKAAGFRLILQMMTGLPGSDDESDIESARRIAALGPDGVRVYPTVIVRDTALCDLWRAGKYREHTVEDAVRGEKLCEAWAQVAPTM